MAVIVCISFLLFFSIAGQATPTTSSSSLANGWRHRQAGQKACDKVWLFAKGSETPPFIRLSNKRATGERDEILVKRTSRSPSHHRWSPQLPGTGLQQVPPNHVFPGDSAPHVLGGPDLSTAAPLHIPADAPMAPNAEPGSSSKRPYKANRRPRGSLTNNLELKLQAKRESKARTRARNLANGRIKQARAERPKRS